MKSHCINDEAAKKGRVCLVTSTFPRWQGDQVPLFVLELAMDLTEVGWQVDVLAPHFKGAATSEEMHGVTVTRFRYLWPESIQTLAYGAGGAVYSLRKRPWKFLQVPFFLLSQVIALYRLVRVRNIDLINSHWLLPQGLSASLVSRLLSVPHVATAHGGDVFGLRSWLFSASKRAALSRADAITVNSSAAESALGGIVPDSLRIERIPMGANHYQTSDRNCIDDARLRYAPDGAMLLLFVGRLTPQKGCADLISAMSILSSSNRKVRLLIAGDGPERASLEGSVKKMRLESYVTFLGWIASEQLSILYSAAEMFVASPTTGVGGEVEAFGLVFAEAAMAGLPTVATRSGGIADVVVDNETGLLVDEDSPAALAKAIEALLLDPDRARSMGAAAQERGKLLFSRARAAQSFSNLFCEISADSTQASRPQ